MTNRRALSSDEAERRGASSAHARPRSERDPVALPALRRIRRRLARIRKGLAGHPSHRRWVLWTCLAGGFATTFTITILGVSLRSIALDLGTQVSTIAWVMTAPMLAQAVSAPLLGKLGDLHGHRRVYLIGFVVATAVAFATALAWNAGSLIGLRTLGQLAGTATMPASMAMLFRAYDGNERVKAMGWMSVVTAGGPVLGLAIGGVLVETIGWRPIFLIQGGLSAIACFIAFFVLSETRRNEDVGLDVPGAAALAGAAFTLTFAINRLPTWGLADPRVGLCMLLTPVLLALFVRIERSAAHPLLPLAFLGRRNFVLPLWVGFCLQFAYMGGFIISPLIMMGVFGLGQAATSMWTMARPISFSASSPVGGHLGSTWGERAMVIVGSTLILMAMIAFAAGAARASMGLIFGGLVLAGLGMGFAQPSLSTIMVSAVSEHDHGIAVSTLSTTSGIGAVAGISILTALCADTADPLTFRNGYGVGALIAGIGVLASLGLRTVDHAELARKAAGRAQGGGSPKPASPLVPIGRSVPVARDARGSVRGLEPGRVPTAEGAIVGPHEPGGSVEPAGHQPVSVVGSGIRPEDPRPEPRHDRSVGITGRFRGFPIGNRRRGS